MKYVLLFCTLALVVVLVSAKPSEFTTPKWDLETCEERAEQARRESDRCKDYHCVQSPSGLVIEGINCIGHAD